MKFILFADFKIGCPDILKEKSKEFGLNFPKTRCDERLISFCESNAICEKNSHNKEWWKKIRIHY